MNKQPMPASKKAPLRMTIRPNPALGLEIARSQILDKYWELANLDTQATKGNIAGQLKALDSLCEELALSPVDKDKSPIQRTRSGKIYRSAWMSDS